MASFGELFGFKRSKDQGDYSGQKPMRYIDSPIFNPTFEGQGGVYDAIKRQNTGYDPQVMSDQESTWAKLAQRQFGEAQSKIGAQTSAGGLGRSSLRGAQSDYANQGVSLGLAEQSGNMRLANEANISQQQMQGRGLGVQGTGADVASQQAIANFEKQEFDRQQAFRERADASQKASFQNTIGNAMALGTMGLKAGDVGGFGRTSWLPTDPTLGGTKSGNGAMVPIEGFGEVNANDFADTMNEFLRNYNPNRGK